MDLESFQKLSKYFLLCDSIEDVMASLRNIDKNLKNNNQEYILDIELRNEDAILEYSVPIYTDKKLCFEFLLQKKEKNKDLIIKKLKEKINVLEEGYFGREKENNNEIQNTIYIIFKKIRNIIDKKEYELFKKYEKLIKKTKIEDIKLNYQNDLLNKINKIINTISLSENNFNFHWKNGPNYILDENKLIGTKTSGSAGFNCILLGDKTLPKNSILSWKIKLKNFGEGSKNWNTLIGIAPENLNQNVSDPYNSCWTFLCSSSKLSLKSGNPTPYKNGKLKVNDIVEVKVDTSKGILSFGVNGIDYGIACNEIPNDNLCPVVILYHEGNSIELID